MLSEFDTSHTREHTVKRQVIRSRGGRGAPQASD